MSVMAQVFCAVDAAFTLKKWCDTVFVALNLVYDMRHCRPFLNHWMRYMEGGRRREGLQQYFDGEDRCMVEQGARSGA